MHERFNNTDAADLFKEALEKDPKNAQAYYGLALVSADGFDNKAIRYTPSRPWRSTQNSTKRTNCWRICCWRIPTRQRLPTRRTPL